jgi:SagB-type dehydrogenase family enzyme
MLLQSARSHLDLPQPRGSRARDHVPMFESPTIAAAQTLALPAPRRDSGCSLESALYLRRTVRQFTGKALALAELAQLVWAAQGLIASGARRTVPSAGALYPLQVHVAAGQVRGLAADTYRYEPSEHELVRIAEGDRRGDLAVAAWDQAWLARAPAILVIAAVEERMTGKYGPRGVRYALMEAGHAAQNVLLQAAALDLDAALIGAFDDAEVHAAAALPQGARPLYLIAVGTP